jgi:Na+/H+ antiporter
MYHEQLLIVITLLLAVFMLTMLGQKLKISYPIFLVLAGLGISFIPGIPKIEITPDMIFLVFLPPLLYEAAWYTSWNDFWKWRRPIGMLAFGLVFLTSIIIAYVSKAIIPGFTLALGFLLGGIISPPDAVAANSVLKNIKISKRITSILEGESLINDASSLIVFRFALLSVISGQFSMTHAVGQFFIVSVMGIVVGLAIAHIVYLIHRFLPTTSSIDAALTLLSPYFMYLVAEEFHFSGVMAVVTGGLFLSYRSHEIFSSSKARIQTIGVWATVVFILNGLVFILIGMELPVIMRDMGEYSIGEAIKFGLIISLIAVVVRILYVMLIAHVPKWLGERDRIDKENPVWKAALVIGWSGMRGVVSLASALSVPFLMTDGHIFPYRNLILFITFVVILVTLVFQGLTLPLVIKWVNLKDDHEYSPEEEQDANIHLALMKAALVYLNDNYPKDIESNELVGFFKNKLEHDISNIGKRLESFECEETLAEEKEAYFVILKELYRVQRKELVKLRSLKVYSDEEIRKQESQLDLDEAKISQVLN